MHKIIYTPHFKKTYQKLTKRNNRLKEITKIAIRKLADNPFSPSLKTHKTSILFLEGPGALRLPETLEYFGILQIMELYY